MHFRELAVKNFLSYHIERFSGLDSNGLTLIQGNNQDQGDSNGAGKSTIPDGISYALFGETLRGVKGDDVVHRDYGADCIVTLHFSHHEKNIQVSRTRKHHHHGNILMVKVDGEEFTKGTVALTQEWLEDFLKIDLELFRCTVLFAQAETFDFVSATDKKQKEILAKIMRLDLEELQFNVKQKLRTVEKEIVEVDGKVSVLESHISDPELAYEEEIKKWESVRAAKLKTLRVDKTILSEKLREMDGVAEQKGKVWAAKERSEARLGENDANWQKIRDDKMTVEAQKTLLNEAIRKYDKEYPGETCPSCFQKVHQERFEEIKNDKLTDLNFRRSSVGDELTRLIEEDMDCRDSHSKLTSVIKTLGQKIVQFEKTLMEKTHAEKEIKQIEKRILELKVETSPFTDKVQEEKKKQKELVAKIKIYGSLTKKLKSQKPFYEFWETAFSDSGIKSFVFDIVCSALTNRANYYLNFLTDGFVTISFDTQKKLKTGELREKFDCTFVCGGKEVSFNSFSGGERRRISLAVDVALSDLMTDYAGTKFNLVFFDEQDSFLDDKGRQAFVRLLKELSTTKRVFVVAHDSALKASFSDVWTIEKKGGVSRLV